jgi:adenylosuccinate lyase
MERSIFRNLSPLDHRYYLANQELFDELSRYLSEEAVIRAVVTVEAEYLRLLVRRVGIPDRDHGTDTAGPTGSEADASTDTNSLLDRIRDLESQVTPEEVYEEEATTHHNVRAVVNVMKRKVPAEIAPLVHLGATSVDMLDTAASLRYRDAVRSVVLPLLLSLEEGLIDLAERHAETAQIGRTHGQHAVPTTFGYAMSEYVARLGSAVQQIDARSTALRGKLSGAVGGYNATSVVTADPIALEAELMDRLGLTPAEHATQIVPPEPLLRLLLEINMAFGIIANLADDLRNLQRSEIAEVRESFCSSQVGSSTMPQKRNPWNSEHVKSLWKAFAPRVQSFFMDQVSEHQRDLTNSASGRFVAEYIAGFIAAAERMRRVIGALTVDGERMRANIAASDATLAEAVYIALALAGDADAHETIRRLTLRAEEQGVSFRQALQDDVDVYGRVAEILEAREISAEALFADPAAYRGRAVERTRSIAERYRRIVQIKRGELTPGPARPPERGGPGASTGADRTSGRGGATPRQE